MDIDNIIDNISEMEELVFADCWSAESIRDTMSQDYNFLLAAYVLGNDIKIRVIEGGPDRDRDEELVMTFGREFYVNEEDYKFAGYLIANIIIDESELLRIAVSPDMRKMGIAKTMMEEYHRYIEPSCIKSILEVRQGNVAARTLYEKMGYNNISIRKGYYNNPCEDAIIYEYQNIQK